MLNIVLMLAHVKRTDNNRPSPPPFAIINHVICDRSASMESFRGVQIEMNKKLIDDAKQQAINSNIKTYLTFTTFDTYTQTYLSNIDINTKSLPNKNELKTMLKPRGSTRFIDTVVEALDKIEEQKQSILNDLPRSVRELNPNIVTILNCTTDGIDNCSINTQKYLKKRMNHYREQNGQAILLTANIDAQTIGKLYGFSEETSLTMNNSEPAAIKYAYDCIIQTSRQVSSGGSATPYTPEQRSYSQATPDTYNSMQCLSPESSPDSDYLLPAPLSLNDINYII